MINSLNIFNYNPRNIVSFKQLPFLEKNNIKYPEEYKCLSQDYGDYFVRSDSDCNGSRLVTVIDDEDCFNVAHNDVEIKKDQKVLYTDNMAVFSERKKGNGLGVVLHLNNIISLLENDLDKIELYSVGSAVLFHGKCKFEPQISDSFTMKSAICTIAVADCDKYPQLKDSVKKANDFLTR